ncbi:ABC transporter ATP-binding protein [Aminobacter sp. AP02]|jgi:putative spermidine/putrescine transport system ATP-binding protein|uniref:ABC transporter ATP-binding protein n=1 Tax=Aminobacter sp. AP02 TaxID=2135737 RepID=UPI000D6CBAE2|nr:ABC transporter ATP-binding protein [Aminobacter sp. AP02]PWK60322.1 putative spermidine/putrescine transport system ATP-binding protein [Aminobacter sp. AP02]
MDLKLKIEGVSKSYGAVRALNPISVDVPAGEFLTLLGPSGSGKTTLLQILSGLVVPDDGGIWIDGKLATHLPPSQRDIGMVFQNYALFPHMTVAENIAFPLQMRRMKSAEIAPKVRRILDIVQLPHLADRFPRELSGGQQQRVALARCAVYEPPIILMDEPLGALDKNLRDQMQLEIVHLHKTLSTTILYVTHDQEEAMAMSDRICLMKDGRIEQLGTPRDLYRSPRTEFVANFFGRSNVFRCTVKEQFDQTVLLDAPVGPIIVNGYRPGQKANRGQTMSVVVRPEDIRFLNGSETADNEIVVRLEQTVMTGATTRYLARSTDDTPIEILSFSSSGHSPAGGECRVGWGKENVTIVC